MSLELTKKVMIIPQSIKSTSPVFNGTSTIVNYFIQDGVLAKRVEACGRSAIVLHGNTNEIAEKYSTDFDIINALFVTFTPKTPEDYLCLIGATQIDFYALADNMYCSLALPFKICQAHSVCFGLLLERSSLPGESGSTPCAAQLFSLTHPYNEIFPIVYKFKTDTNCQYAFKDRKMSVVPKDTAANWSPAFSGSIDLVMCYDTDERTNHIFMIRKCTKKERVAAKNDLGMLNSSALMHTPSSVQSFYSPNFFNRRFAESRNFMHNHQPPKHQSPALNFTNPSNQIRQHDGSASCNTAIAGSSTAGFLYPSAKVTPVRRYYTRSIAAAEKLCYTNPNPTTNTMLFSSPAQALHHSSLEHNATLNRMRLKQNLALVANGSSFFTPRHAGIRSTVDLSDLLSFGGDGEDDDGPPPSLDMAVEFCLEWFWSEPVPTLLQQEESRESVRSGSSSSVGTERVANKLEKMRVSSSASSHSADDKMNRMASNFFVSRNAFKRSEKYFVFHIAADRRVRVLQLNFVKIRDKTNTSFAATAESPPALSDSASSASSATCIRGNAVIPFLHAPFFMVLESLSLSDEQLCAPSMVSLYSGPYKLTNIALNVGMGTQLLRVLPAGRCSNALNRFNFQAMVASDEEDSKEATARLFECQLQIGFCSELASKSLHAVCAAFSPDRQFHFLSDLVCNNPWRVVETALRIPCINEVPIERVELALLFEQLSSELGLDRSAGMPFSQLLQRIRTNTAEGDGMDDESSKSKRTRFDGNAEAEMMESDKFWELLQSDIAILKSTEEMASKCVRHLLHATDFSRRILELLKKLIDGRDRQTAQTRVLVEVSQGPRQNRNSASTDAHTWVTAPRWSTDLRAHNAAQMLDSSLPVLIPSKALGPHFNEMQQREQHEQFLVSVAIRTLTRPFGMAALRFRTRHGFPEEDKDPLMGVRPICLNGRIHPGRNQVDFPLNDQFPSHKLTMDWANFYAALAHGLSFCGAFPQKLFTSATAEEELPSTTKAGLLLAAGLNGKVLNAMNLYDIHALVTQNNRYLVVALLLGCAATHRGTSEVHIYKMIATHLPFLLQPTLCEFRIELVVQMAALTSLGLLFCETANYALSSQLLNQMALEVPCESDQASERYSFVLAAGMAIGLINLGKGKEISDTEIPISLSPSLMARLVKLLNGGERHLAYLNYDRVRCPCMRMHGVVGPNASGSNSALGRRYAPGGAGADAVTEMNGNSNTGAAANGNAPSSAAAQHSSSSSTRLVDHSGIGQPSSNHVRELSTLNVHLTSPAAAVALGLMYLRTGDAWMRNTLAITDTFYEIERIRPDVLMIRTLCRCLVDFDAIGCSLEWMEAQTPNIIRKYVKLFLEAKSKKDMWWEDFIDMETVAKAYFYCSAGACFAMALRHASSWNTQPLRIIQYFYELLQPNSGASTQFSWTGFAKRAGKNCINACVNVCALSMALVMAGSGDLQTMRLLRKIRNGLPRAGEVPIPKDSSVHSLHVFANLALGLLQLGHGRQCLANSNLAIAALVIALFPLFPHSIIDNRVYFQPLRFLWMLAVKPRTETTPEGGGRRSEGETPPVVECPRCGPVPIQVPKWAS